MNAAARLACERVTTAVVEAERTRNEVETGAGVSAGAGAACVAVCGATAASGVELGPSSSSASVARGVDAGAADGFGAGALLVTGSALEAADESTTGMARETRRERVAYANKARRGPDQARRPDSARPTTRIAIWSETHRRYATSRAARSMYSLTRASESA